MPRRLAARALPLPRDRGPVLTTTRGTCRTLLSCVGLGALLAAALPAAAQSGGRAVALTFDDLPGVSTRNDIATIRALTRGILTALRRHDAPAIGFVNENKLEQDDQLDTARVALLERWLEAGMALGNHSYSHPDLHDVPLERFQEDVLRGERMTRRLLEARGSEPQWFRHPFLHTGRTLETKRTFERFLADHGYRVAPVTVDNYDYVFARAYDHALDRGDAPAARRVADAFLAYMDTVFGYYEAQSRALLGREPPQVLLLHANRLNGDHLDRLLTLLERRGYAFVSIDEALRDPAYGNADTFTGPAGITWLHRWALTAGKRGEFFAGEPAVPAWIEELAGG